MDSCSLPDALEAVETASLWLVALQQRPGTHLQMFLDVCGEGHRFEGVNLSPCQLTADQLSSKWNSICCLAPLS
ncbi:hypothetical protein DPMN_083701 [Dreissena polymorpha]|uniref:Uncharacterized protein n=1 Tax=Dreissena polymorpha TaxID=45954 RepID=A0A9D3YCG2_DREPO|nr:hypothetical protein DPMN_083701 [Dreissena polymorpha]